MSELILAAVAATPNVDTATLMAAIERVEAEAAYARSSLLLLFGGMVVMFMSAGFCMLEAGLVRQKNAATICLKNVAIYAIAGLAYLFVGYRLMYDLPEGAKILGTFAMWSPDDLETVNGAYASGADWFFQMAFVATAASIVSGALAERIKLWPFLIFSLVLTGLIYPIEGAWKWGGGWLADLGFQDFAGSAIVHVAGGVAALVGAIILGPRDGKYGSGGRVNPMPGSNLPLAALGTFILWFGWFGFNGGSQLAFGGPADVNAVAKIFANTNTAAAAGFIAAAGLTAVLYKKIDLTLALNGAIGGLVSITAEPLAPAPWAAALIGLVGGLIVVVAVPLLDRLKIDDVVGAIPAHLLCGVWGTLIVAANTQASVTNAAGAEVQLGLAAQFGVQILGLGAIGLFVGVTSLAVWLALDKTMGLRADSEAQLEGLDKVECGLEAYPEFAKH